jgi:alginate export protein
VTDRRLRLARRVVCLAAVARLCAAVPAGAQMAASDGFAGSSARAQEAAPAQAVAPARPWPPRYAERRFEENWRPLDWAKPHAGSRDVFDRIKALRLNDSGSAWIGFAGSLRGRLAYQSTVTYGGPFDFEPTMWTGRVRGSADLHLGKFRGFGEYIYSYSAIEALVDTFGAPSSRLGFDAPNRDGDILNLFGEYQSRISRGWEGGVWGGRRELLMGNQRILSPGNWLLNRHTFDGAGGWLNNSRHRLEGFVTRPRVPVPDRFTRRDDETTLSGLVYSRTFVRRGDQRIRFEPYLLDIRRNNVTFTQGTANENRYTMGALAQGDVGATGLDFEFEGMYQYGRWRTEFDRGIVNAYAWVSKVGYRFRNVMLAPRPSISLEYASGDSDPNDTSLGTFDPLYPLAWSFYGFHAAFDRKNFVAGGLHLEGAYKRTYFRTTYFPMMWRAQLNDGVYNSFNEIARRPDFQSRGGNFPDLPWASRNIGQQIDFGFFWQPTHHLQFYATYLHFFAGRFLTDTQTATPRHMNGVMLLTEFAF